MTGVTTYTNRELSWLSFNERVLEEAARESVPLANRLNFLAIYQSNLDEFFMVRVGSLRHLTVYFPGDKDSKTGWNTDIEDSARRSSWRRLWPRCGS